MNRRNFEWNEIPDFSNSDVEGEVSKCIASKFYVGSADYADDRANMDWMGITHVISIQGSGLRGPQYTTHDNIVYLRIMGVEDDPSASLLKHIEPALEFYDSIPEDGKLLIHCEMGVSRSASLAIACLMHMNPRWTMEDAYNTVKEARSIIGPEPEFLFQIKEYFDSIRSGFESPEKAQRVHDLYKGFDPDKVYISRSLETEPCQKCGEQVKMIPYSGGGGMCGCPPETVTRTIGEYNLNMDE